MSDKFLSDEAKAYKKWFAEFEKRTENLPEVDYETHEGPRDASKVLDTIHGISMSVCFLVVGGMVLTYAMGTELSTWAINYSGDFIRITPSLIQEG